MTLQEIQDLINSNQIDLRKLDSERLMILDGLQKKGELQTRPISDVLKDQVKVAEELAAKQNYEQDPIRAKTADLLNRDTAQAVFDMGFFGAQLLMDRTRLAKIVANPTKYATIASKLKDGVFAKGSVNQFSDALKNVDRLVGLDPSKPLGAIMRPVVAGSLAYSGGGQAYDIADEIIRTKEGIESKGYKEKDNPYFKAADDFATGLAWSGGAELLAPAAFGAATLVRKFFGLEGDYAKTIKAIAERQGLEASWIEMADPNSIGGKIIQSYNKVFGQLPFVGGPAVTAKKERISAFAKKFEDTFNLQPNMHMAELASVSEEVANQMKNNYVRYRANSDLKYTLFREMSKQFGDPMIIPLAHQRKLYNSLISNNFAPTEFKLTLDNEVLQTPIGRFRAAYESLLKANRPISPNEFLELQVILNDAVSRSPNNEKMIGAYKAIKKAMEKDFASITLNPTDEVFLKYPPSNRAIADVVLEPADPVKMAIQDIKGANGVKLNQDAINRLKAQLVDANNYFQNNIISFETNLADKIRNSFGKNLFSEKQLAGFFESGNFNADQLAKRLADNVFMSSANKESFDAVTNLQRLLEADVYKINPKTGDYVFEKKGTVEGNKALKRLFSSYLSDAYQKSFVKRADDGTDFISSLIGRERTLQEARLPAKTIADMKLPNGEGVSKYIRGNIEFDPDTFRKLVLPSEEYAKKFEMILGPKQGKAMVKELDDLMGYITALNKIDTPSSSTFLARRLILGGVQSLGVIGGMYGFGALGTAALLALGVATNKFMLNPQRMKAINGVFKTYLQAAEKGDTDLMKPLMNRSLIQMLTVLNNDYPGYKKFDARGISTKELLEKLSNEKYVPDDLKGLNMNKREKERLFPTVPNDKLSQVLPPPEIDDLFKPLGGAPRNVEEEQIMRTAARTMPPGPIQTALPRLPGLPVGLNQPTQQQAPVNPQRYAAAFPTDALGILAAQGRTGNA